MGRNAGLTSVAGIGAELPIDDIVPLDCKDDRLGSCGDCGGLLESDPYGLFASSEVFDHVDMLERVEGRLPDAEVDSLPDLLVVFDSTLFLFAFSGKPSHLLFTLGTWSGNLLDDTPESIPEALVTPVPFSCIFFFWASANSSSAMFVGSFSVRNPSIPLFFGFTAADCFMPVTVVLFVRTLLDPEPEPD